MVHPNGHFLEDPHISARIIWKIPRKTFANIMNLLKNVSTSPRYFPLAVNPGKDKVFRIVIAAIK